MPKSFCPICRVGTIKYTVKGGYNSGHCSNCPAVSSYTWIPEYINAVRWNPELIPIYLKRPDPNKSYHF